MPMIFEIMDDCKRLNHVRQDDPYGGSEIETWEEGSSFKAAIIKINSPEMILAEKQGVTEVYTIVTQKGFRLEYHDVFKRDKDGMIFRVIGNTVDSEAPGRSTIPIGKVTAERWVLPQ